MRELLHKLRSALRIRPLKKNLKHIFSYSEISLKVVALKLLLTHTHALPHTH